MDECDCAVCLFTVRTMYVSSKCREQWIKLTLKSIKEMYSDYSQKPAKTIAADCVIIAGESDGLRSHTAARHDCNSICRPKSVLFHFDSFYCIFKLSLEHYSDQSHIMPCSMNRLVRLFHAAISIRTSSIQHTFEPTKMENHVIWYVPFNTITIDSLYCPFRLFALIFLPRCSASEP